MKAIILSAGQGRRLLPLTESRPKCLLPVRGSQPVLEVQLRALAACGVEEAVVMVGFGADQVEAFLAGTPIPGIRVRTFYNPFFAQSDNLVTVWLARPEMADEFLILNGDTLFEPAVLEKLLASPPAPLTVTINEKARYDDDDMKVKLAGGRRLQAVGKKLTGPIDGESIGLMRFQGEGGERFREALDAAVRRSAGMSAWYLSVVDALAPSMRIETASITGSWWGEVDSPEDLTVVREGLERLDKQRPARAHASPREERIGRA
ncbi:MAG: phosphocholine cytidylyltransferase family protein [Myxococcota bacterium]|nr:phosphocholine cytidylyltransferase family protein [Myxococcales bacterium]